MTDHAQQQKNKELKAHVKRKWIYKGKVVSLYTDTMLDIEPSHDWEVVVHEPAVSVIPINKQGELLLIKQWRRAVNKILYEIPAGCLEENEEPQSAAQRELQEETGYMAHTFIPLGSCYTTPGFCNELLYLFIATDLKESKLPHDPHEAIDVEFVGLDQALQMITSQEIQDLKTIAGILYYVHWKQKGMHL